MAVGKIVVVVGYAAAADGDGGAVVVVVVVVVAVVAVVVAAAAVVADAGAADTAADLFGPHQVQIAMSSHGKAEGKWPDDVGWERVSGLAFVRGRTR